MPQSPSAQKPGQLKSQSQTQSVPAPQGRLGAELEATIERIPIRQ